MKNKKSILILFFFLPSISSVLFDCYPEPDAVQSICESRGCQWKPADKQQNEPWCTLKEGYGYSLKSVDGSTYTLTKAEGPLNPWGNDDQQIQLVKKEYGNVLNVQIGVKGRYKPPLELPKLTENNNNDLEFLTDERNGLFTFSIERRSSRRKLFDTSIGGLMFSEKFIQIATYLPSEHMYGWGENIHQTLKHDFSKYLTWSLFARDQPPNSANLDTQNLYGVHPYYMIVEPDGKAHGVLILNSNAQEVTTAPGPSLVYRTIGGLLDIYFFPGPTPEQVTQQYLSFIGKPFLPAYWALGYQLSRYGYKDLNEMKERIGAVRNSGIPIDIAVADIDYMDRYKDFTTGPSWNGFEDYMAQMHDWTMKSILIFDPAIQVNYEVFQRALNQKAKFIEWETKEDVQRKIQNMYPLTKDTKIMLGVVWPDDHVAFPDFLDSTNNTQQWWISEFKKYHDKIQFDGIWIDMNEPSNFGTNQDHPWYYDFDDHPNTLPLFCPVNGSKAEFDMPPYKTRAVWRFGSEKTGAYLASNTLCMSAVQDNGRLRFYDTKNLYGLTESIYTQKAQFESTGKRGAVVSRSTFPSSGRYTGHWLGDNTARWEDLRTSIIGAQEFNLFGIPYVGSDVCGFIGTSNEELCLRWQQMGSFHSFFRNHNTLGAPAQDPAVWPAVAEATRKANLFRYQYLPYLFSLHFEASKSGATVIRPVFFEFPQDSETYNLGYQFMWGRSIMVAPVVHEGAETVNVYLPEDYWYSLYDNFYGKLLDIGYYDYPAPKNYRIPTFVRGASVVPRQTPSMTTTLSRKNPFEILIAPCPVGCGHGVLYWDDGESIVNDFDTHDYHQINFKYNSTEEMSVIYMNHTRRGSVQLPTLDIIEIFNYKQTPDFGSFRLNGERINVNVQTSHYNKLTKILYISTAGLVDFNKADSLIILEWNNLGKSALDVIDVDKMEALKTNRWNF